MSLNNCDHCNKNFSTKYSLVRHQKTIKVKIDVIYECTFCSKILSSKQKLKYHVEICKKKNKNTEEGNIEKINQKIEEIMVCLKNNPLQQNITINTDNSTNNTLTNTTTHNYGSILSLTKEMIQETFNKNYTMEDLLESQKGLADFTSKHFLSGKDKPLYLCTDKSRQKFIFTDKEQKETEDSNAFIIIKLMSKGFSKVDELYKQELNILKRRLKHFIEEDDNTNIVETHRQLKQLEEVYKKIKNIDKDGDVYRKQLSKLLPSSLENRILHDDYLSDYEEENENLLEQTIKETIKEENESEPVNEPPLNEPLYDKTARHIGGITYGGLRMFKNHYIKTGEKVYHPKHKNNGDYMKQFDDFCENDD